MTTETRTPQDIERDIAHDRSRLTAQMKSLQEQLSLDGALRQMGDQLRQHGSDLGTGISRTVRENPAAATLTGIGLAWLLMGNRSSSEPQSSTASPDMGERRFRTPPGVGNAPATGTPGLHSRGATLPDWAQDEADGTAPDQSWSSKAGAAVSDASEKAKMHATQLRDRLARGTEDLSEEARSRIIAARHAALDARDRASQMMAGRSGQAQDMFERQPLVVGALAAALGAAVGSSLPRTTVEDDAMGRHSDTLMQEAERIYQQERAKAQEVVKAATDEAKSVARETRDDMNNGAPGDKTAVQAVKDEAKTSAKRVADAATSKAKEKKLGKVAS